MMGIVCALRLVPGCVVRQHDTLYVRLSVSAVAQERNGSEQMACLPGRGHWPRASAGLDRRNPGANR